MKKTIVIQGNQGFFCVALGFSACTSHFKDAVFSSFHEKAQYPVEMGEYTGYIRIDCTDVKAKCSHGSFVEAVRSSLLDMVTVVVPSQIKGELADEAEVVMDGYKFNFKIVQYERDREHNWEIIEPSDLEDIPNKEKLGRVMELVVTIDEPAVDQSGFDKKLFLRALEMQCTTFGLISGQVWGLAENVFAAMMRPKTGDIEWTVNFYFDDRDVKLRDEDSGKQYMAREVQLIMMGGFTAGALSEDPENHICIAYFHEDPTGFNPVYVINYASQLFAKVDNGEIAWFDSAELILFSMVGR